MGVLFFKIIFFERVHLIENIEWDLFSRIWIYTLGVRFVNTDYSKVDNLTIKHIELGSAPEVVRVEIYEVPGRCITEAFLGWTEPLKDICKRELLGGALEAHSDDNVIARESWRARFPFH